MMELHRLELFKLECIQFFLHLVIPKAPRRLVATKADAKQNPVSRWIQKSTRNGCVNRNACGANGDVRKSSVCLPLLRCLRGPWRVLGACLRFFRQLGRAAVIHLLRRACLLALCLFLRLVLVVLWLWPRNGASGCSKSPPRS